MARYKVIFTQTVEEKMELVVDLPDNLTNAELLIAMNEATAGGDPNQIVHPVKVDSIVQSIGDVHSFKRLDK